MTRRFAGYLIFLIALYLTLNYSGYDSLMIVFFFLLLLPPLSFVALLVTRYFLAVEIRLPHQAVARGDDFTVIVEIRNPSPLPLPAIDLRLHHQKRSSFRKLDRIRLRLGPLAKERFAVIYHFVNRGRFDIQLKQVRIYDSCGFFYLPIAKQTLASVSTVDIWPRRLPQISDAVANTTDVEADVSRSPKISQEIDEVARLRTYRPGDKLKLVHWSVSARMQDLHVREFEEAHDLETSVILADALPSGTPVARLLADAGGEMALRLMAETLLQQLPTRLILAGLNGIDEAQSLFVSGMDALDVAASAIARQLPETAVLARESSLRNMLDRGLHNREDLTELVDRHLHPDSKIVYLIVYAVDERLLVLARRLMRQLNKLFLVYIAMEVDPKLDEYRLALAHFNIAIITIDPREHLLAEIQEGGADHE